MMTDNEIQELLDSAGIDYSSTRCRFEGEFYTHLEGNDAQVIAEMFHEMDNWPYAQIQFEVRQKIKRMFSKYSLLDTLSRKRLDKLIIQHMQYCSNSGNTSYVRQHNTFVLHYINGISFRKVSRGQGICFRTVFKDIDAVLDRMMIYLFGFYGVRWDKL